MGVLILGLVLFLGAHSARIVADGWRTRTLVRTGKKAWKGVYSLISLAGLVLIVWGYGLARQQPVVLWTPPRGMNHLAALLMLVSFVLLVAAYVPGNAIRRRLQHPMVLGVKVWALAHLLANGTLADVVLFGAFLVWAVLDFRSARRRPLAGHREASPHPGPGGEGAKTGIAMAGGVVLWAVFAFWAHGWLFGVRPLG
ncbi:NnrU family protein [Ramlibacter tataouinensis]|uniref:Candidate membrane protein n=1 Tax=Ramlibacter tataouinensis (strain ATCC BAA-407 / DSM 14655 / LMG 21543 / TTB310) TaxID=365046 RepID=F5Y2A2_RAMTT|nr:NnrU family protein [Ramlibacter tataouinensis]AEG91076.1 candidate membrane protein [Ramlibacter tataouinensis TTB310]